MSVPAGVGAAKAAKNDEFYTQIPDIEREMQSYVDYDTDEVEERVSKLMADEAVTDKRGIYEYVLGGCKDTRLLNVRLFDTRTCRTVYERQTREAKDKGVSNCPLCAHSEGPNHARIWRLEEMDADHVSAWSKGGSTDIGNCQMLCRTHNRSKGNR